MSVKNEQAVENGLSFCEGYIGDYVVTSDEEGHFVIREDDEIVINIE